MLRDSDKTIIQYQNLQKLSLKEKSYWDEIDTSYTLKENEKWKYSSCCSEENLIW